MDDQHKEYRQAMQFFTHSLLRASMGLGLAPLSVLPEQSQQRFKEAGHEFICGLAKPTHGFAHTLDKIVK